MCGYAEQKIRRLACGRRTCRNHSTEAVLARNVISGFMIGQIPCNAPGALSLFRNGERDFMGFVSGNFLIHLYCPEGAVIRNHLNFSGDSERFFFYVAQNKAR